jgi:CheY-like chemotaxis protein
MSIAELRFLVVEDHEFQRSILLRILAGLGATKIFEAVDGRAALKIVQTPDTPMDIIISDLDMPGMDGAELMRHLGAAGESVAASVILTSALGDLLLGSVETMTRDYGIRILGVIEKPVTPAKLDALIKLHKPDMTRPGTGTKIADQPFTREQIVAKLKKLDQWLRIAQPATPVDRSVLAAITGGDTAVECEILTEFRRINDQDAVMLKLAVDRRDMPQVTNASDRIKGASRTVGATALAAVCERLEHASRANDWKDVEANMRAFHRELERLNTYCEGAKCTSPS